MSTIRVNAIQSTSTTDGGISIDNSGHVTLDGQSLPSAGPLSNRNLIINGAMQVAQRGTSTTGVTSVTYLTDRFRGSINSLGTWTISNENTGLTETWETGATERFRHYDKITCTTAAASPAADGIAATVQFIEAQSLQHLNFGQSTAKPLILSFWVKSNKTGSASFEIRQPDDSNRHISFSYTINAANTWEYKTISIPADTGGTINDDNGAGLQILWWLNSGSDHTGGSHQTTWGTRVQANGNASNLGVGGAVDDYFALTGVQLEVGSVATPFEHRSFGDELVRCQRYYQKTYNYADAPGTSTNQSHVEGNAFNAVFTRITWHFSTAMRAQPSCRIYSTSGTIDKFRNLDGGGSDVNGAISYTGENRAGLQCSNTGLTNGRHIAAHATADAEF